MLDTTLMFVLREGLLVYEYCSCLSMASNNECFVSNILNIIWLPIMDSFTRNMSLFIDYEYLL